MIRCTPRGLCSWNFDLSGAGHSASADFRWASEQGEMVIDGVRYEVTKHGLASGRWTLDRSPNSLIEAQKPSPFTRTFEIAGESVAAELRAASALGRKMELSGRGVDCTIAPEHAFTKRAIILGNWDDFRVVAFAFWLSVLMWRRADNQS